MSYSIPFYRIGALLFLLGGCEAGLVGGDNIPTGGDNADEGAEIRIGNFPGPDGPIRAAYVVHEGAAVVGGDIFWPINSALSINAAAGPFTRWPGGVVAYDNSVNNSAFEKGVDAWNAVSSQTGVTLVRRTNQSDYVKVVEKQGCYSYMGLTGGAQDLSLGTGCYKAQAIHEIGHAIGMMHEHTRADRDSYIRFNYDNLVGGINSQFARINLAVTQGSTNYTNYDFLSIMHYRTRITDTRFIINPNIPLYEVLGNGPNKVDNNELSAGDIAGVAAMYQGYGGNTGPDPVEETCSIAQCAPYYMNNGDCKTLSTGDFSCESDCLVKVLSCNGNPTPPDGGDTLPAGYQYCADGNEYYQFSYHCDSIVDCQDGSDEADCGSSGGSSSSWGDCNVNAQQGDCIDTSTTTCFGSLFPGNCPGGNEIICCI